MTFLKGKMNIFHIICLFWWGLTVILLFLFIWVEEANAAGYGWAFIHDRSSRSGNCGAPYNADLRLHAVRNLNHIHLFGDLGLGRGQSGIDASANGVDHITLNCYNPYDPFNWFTRVSDYWSTRGAIIITPQAPQENKLNHFWVRLVPNTDLPSIRLDAPTNGQWFRNPPSPFNVTISNRLMPDSGSTKITQFQLVVQKTPGSAPGGDYLRNFVINGNWPANSSSLTPITFSLPNPGTMPSGIYNWAGYHLEDKLYATNVTSVYSEPNVFGVDGIDPTNVNASYIRAGGSCPGSAPEIIEGNQYQICGRAQDTLSGLREIRLYRVLSDDSSTPSSWGLPIRTCSYSAFPISIRDCMSPLQNTSNEGGRWVHYRACAEDRVGNGNVNDVCDTGMFLIKEIKPWLETRGPSQPSYDDYWSGGVIGSRGCISVFGDCWSFLQERDPNDPSGARYTSPYTIIGIGNVHPHIRSRRGWIIKNYTINMEKFPAPIGPSIYDGLWQKYSTRCQGGVPTFSGLTPSSIAAAIDLARSTHKCNIIRYSGTGIAEINNSDWESSSYTGPPGVVFFPNYDGFGSSLLIKRNIVIANGTGLIFVVKGHINVCRNQACNNLPLSLSNSVRSIDGFYITDGRFITDSFGTSAPLDWPLTINGSVINFNPDGIDWRRNNGGYGRSVNSAWNRNFPSESIRYQPKYLWLFKEELGDAVTVLEEVAP